MPWIVVEIQISTIDVIGSFCTARLIVTDMSKILIKKKRDVYF